MREMLGPMFIMLAQLAALPSVAVLDVTARGGVSADTATLLTDDLTVRLRQSARFSRVVATSELMQVLSYEQRRQAANCDDAGCLAEIAGALGVDYVAFGNAGRVGTLWVLNLKLVDARKGHAASSVSRPIKGDDEGVLILSMPDATLELLGPLGAPATRAPVEAVETAPPAEPPWKRPWLYAFASTSLLMPACAACATGACVGCWGTYALANGQAELLLPVAFLTVLSGVGAVLCAPVACAAVVSEPVLSIWRGRGRFSLVDHGVAAAAVVVSALLGLAGMATGALAAAAHVGWLVRGFSTGGSDRWTGVLVILASVLTVSSVGMVLGALVSGAATGASAIVGTL